MNETEFEYLLNTLSDAQSRAAEIVVAVRARVGVDHRLSELGNSAVSQIETVLRDVRQFVVEQRDPSNEPNSMESNVVTRSAQPAVKQPDTADDTSNHWFPDFVNELLQRYRTSGGITFEIVEQVLQQHKDAFMKDLEIARRMYLTYPQLFQGVPPQE